MNDGVAVGNLKLKLFAYADDVNVFCSLIDVCNKYSITWTFKFGDKKYCMIYGIKFHPNLTRQDDRDLINN